MASCTAPAAEPSFAGLLPDGSHLVIGMLTSGGDSCGMNASVRAVVRAGIRAGAKVYGVMEGYEGLVENDIRPMTWASVGGSLQRGGTILGSARCASFRTREGRLRAALNIVSRGINALCVIGGDGSLTGADVFRAEWPELLKELVDTGRITSDMKVPEFLRIVGLVGSIDNDMAGTDYTIGMDTALNRIVEACDNIATTASSHRRSFVVEVMGRMCGWLALCAGICTNADYLFIPELAQPRDWQDKVARALQRNTMLRRHMLIILAEGACDVDGNHISGEQIQKLLAEQGGHEVRITVLGHVQRGGTPTARDRIIPTMMGVEAVKAFCTMGNESLMVGVVSNRYVRLPLVECVAKTKAIGDMLTRKDFAAAAQARGSDFQAMIAAYRVTARAVPHDLPSDAKRYKFAVLTAGASSPGMNTAIRVFVRHAIEGGHTVVAVNDGWQGFIDGSIKDLSWRETGCWTAEGGSFIGTSRRMPSAADAPRIAEMIKQHGIHAVVVLGSYEGYTGVAVLRKESTKIPELRLPFALLPCSISNGIPGTAVTVGSDTALNNIIWALDRIKSSATGARRVFTAEIMGSYCGYLTLMAAIACGAERAYLHEEGLTLCSLTKDVEAIKRRFATCDDGAAAALLLRNEQASSVYSTKLISQILTDESHGAYDCRQSILGHIQQGGNPTPADRCIATQLASAIVPRLLGHLNAGTLDVAECVGIYDGHLLQQQTCCLEALDLGVCWSPLSVVLDNVESAFRRPKHEPWLAMSAIADVLSSMQPFNDPHAADAAAAAAAVTAENPRQATADDLIATKNMTPVMKRQLTMTLLP